jgi:hypothetical protein
LKKKSLISGVNQLDGIASHAAVTPKIVTAMPSASHEEGRRGP